QVALDDRALAYRLRLVGIETAASLRGGLAVRLGEIPHGAADEAEDQQQDKKRQRAAQPAAPRARRRCAGRRLGTRARWLRRATTRGRGPDSACPVDLIVHCFPAEPFRGPNRTQRTRGRLSVRLA